MDDGADEFLFDDAKQFRDLQIVSLRSNLHNATHLKQLALNYPNVTVVCISQESPLDDESLKCLQTFKNLRGLELWCPLETPSLFEVCLPSTLEYLQFAGTLPLRRLPHVSELKLNQCRVDFTFFQKLEAPRLERLDFSNVDLGPGSLQSLGRIKSLRELSLYNSNINARDVESLRLLKYLHSYAYGSEMQQTTCWDKAEQFFKEKNFQQAANHYKASVFSKPSAYGYLQLARCYLQLGNTRLASEYCADAASIDPTNAEVAAVTAEVKSRKQASRDASTK